MRVPMSVIGGFLGAGKTTLLNRVLAGRHGVRYAVLVNDFGELSIDGDLVAAHGGDTITFANGCVCCTMGDDLVGAIDRLLDGDRRPEQILVEASGVADPAAVADVATLHPGLARDLVVVLADAETVRARHGDERLRDTVDRQLAAADLVVLNKCDRVTEAATEAAESWLRGRGRVPVVRAIDADLPMELLAAERVVPASPAKAGGAPDHYHQFRSQFVPCPNPVDPDRLRAAFKEMSAAGAPRQGVRTFGRRPAGKGVGLRYRARVVGRPGEREGGRGRGLVTAGGSAQSGPGHRLHRARRPSHRRRSPRRGALGRPPGALTPGCPRGRRYRRGRASWERGHPCPRTVLVAPLS